MNSHVEVAQSDATKQQSWLARIMSTLPGARDRHARTVALDRAHALYIAVVRRARSTVLYTEFGAVDTENGRLEMIILHLVLTVRALRRHGTEGKMLAQSMIDLFIKDMDRSFREGGVGDLSVGKKVRQVAGYYHAWATKLDPLLDAHDEVGITTVLMDNLEQGENREYDRLTKYIIRQENALFSLPPQKLVNGIIDILPLDPAEVLSAKD
jgi:cytochrome b pre-mRNA-processing protein 3